MVDEIPKLTGETLFLARLAFTYQGRLVDGQVPGNGKYDLQFTIYTDAEEGEIAIGPLTYPGTYVNKGMFTVTIDLGAPPYNPDARWLEIAVRADGRQNFLTLSPRTEITPTPFALHALSVPSGAIAGTYSESVAFSNAANVFNGTFVGDGSGLTGVNPGGNVTTAAMTASNVTTRVGRSIHTNSAAFIGYGSVQLPSGPVDGQAVHRCQTRQAIFFKKPGCYRPRTGELGQRVTNPILVPASSPTRFSGCSSP